MFHIQQYAQAKKSRYSGKSILKVTTVTVQLRIAVPIMYNIPTSYRKKYSGWKVINLKSAAENHL